VLQCVAVCCSVLQVCCSVLQCVAVRDAVGEAVGCSVYGGMAGRTRQNEVIHV